MSRKDWRVRVDHILTAINEIYDFVKNHDQESFLKDRMAYLAVERNLEIIAEASKNIPENVKDEYREIPWHRIVATRNVVAHLYDEVDEDILWNVIKMEIPRLEEVILKIKQKYGDAGS